MSLHCRRKPIAFPFTISQVHAAIPRLPTCTAFILTVQGGWYVGLGWVWFFLLLCFETETLWLCSSGLPYPLSQVLCVLPSLALGVWLLNSVSFPHCFPGSELFIQSNSLPAANPWAARNTKCKFLAIIVQINPVNPSNGIQRQVGIFTNCLVCRFTREHPLHPYWGPQPLEARQPSMMGKKSDIPKFQPQLSLWCKSIPWAFVSLLVKLKGCIQKAGHTAQDMEQMQI